MLNVLYIINLKYISYTNKFTHRINIFTSKFDSLMNIQPKYLKYLKLILLCKRRAIYFNVTWPT